MAKYSIEIPLDASAIEDFKPEAPVKVVVQTTDGTQSRTVELSAKGLGSAGFTFDDVPKGLRVLVGPHDASDEEMLGLQTLSVDISSRLLTKREARLPVIIIPPYYWWWWLRWCRTFVIRGRVICADGSPVPGAKVCAFDVDWWFFWWSTQQIGCAYTDANGVFEIRFRWCCYWWPWWWWRHRAWEFNPLLAEKISPVLGRAPDIRLNPSAGHQPTLAVFDELLAETGVRTTKALAPHAVANIERLREGLLAKLPVAPELERLRIWPWWPWYPWRDCAPDVIFRVTQDCQSPGTVIVSENVFQTRWDIPTSLDVTLVANEKACCRRICDDPPCIDSECMVITQVCNIAIDEIGGNLGAPAVVPALEGYVSPNGVTPGTAAYNGDRPLAGTVTVEKNSGAMLNVDYYEIETFDGVNWVPLPAGAALNFSRRYMHMLSPTFPTTDVPFDFTNISGHNVVQSKEFFEANSGLAVWGFDYIWLVNEFLVVPLDSTKFGDGQHRFRVVGWQISGGSLTNRRVLPICATNDDNNLILFFDNRVVPNPGHPASHNCGGVHICTSEPDTHITQVRINGQPVEPCGTVDAAAGNLEVDFLVTDPDGHLAVYSLVALYGLNLSVNLLDRPGASVVALLPGTQTGWNPGDGSGTYGVALSQGATQPHWQGGRYRLTVPAAQAFPEPCCYQLQLRGWKRNIVSCGGGFDFNNTTQLTLGVGVCPPPLLKPGLVEAIPIGAAHI